MAEVPSNRRLSFASRLPSSLGGSFGLALLEGGATETFKVVLLERLSLARAMD
jgi:hypothetical protein